MKTEKILELDIVKLDDDREGVVVHIYADGKAFEVEFDSLESDGLNTETIEASRIKSLVWRRGK